MTRYFRDSYEYRLLECLSELDEFFVSRHIPYGVFGGSGIAAYVGYFPRKLHDLDFLIPERQCDSTKTFLSQRGFQLLETEKSRKANFLKFTRRNHIYEMIVSLFPGEFNLLDLDNPELPIVGTYDFRGAIERSGRREISSLDGQKRSRVSVIPMEDLVISKLWPTFEPNTVHDLILLFSSDEALALDIPYMRRKLDESGDMSALCNETFELFEAACRRTAWYKLSNKKNSVKKASAILKKGLFPKVAPQHLQR